LETIPGLYKRTFKNTGSDGPVRQIAFSFQESIAGLLKRFINTGSEIVGLFTCHLEPRVQMAFSVSPRRAAPEPSRKMAAPRLACTGRNTSRKWEARPGHKKEMKPATC
jgi:hypothetical protein